MFFAPLGQYHTARVIQSYARKENSISAMNHDEWRAEVSRLMNLDETRLPALHEQWTNLLSKTETAKQSSVAEWHIQQTLSLYATSVRKLAALDSAAELDERIGDDAEAQMKYWRIAAGTALAQAALDRFELDSNDERALALARRALEHQIHSNDSANVFEQLVAELQSRGKL